MYLWLKVIKFIWWVFVATIPVWVFYEAQMLSGYNCPALGDCYDFAALVKQNLEVFSVVAAILLWPVCIWNLGGQHIFMIVKNK